MRGFLRKPVIWLLWKWKRPRRVGKRVICMHSVHNQERFYDRMTWLMRNWAVVPLHGLVGWREDIPAVSLTFDDGSETWFDNVLPVLNELDLHGVFFTNDGEIAKRLDSGHTTARLIVGGHTRDHVNLGRVVEPMELDYQIEPRVYFAYPYGTPETINPTVVRHLENHYQIDDAFTCIPGWYPGRKYLQPRDSLNLEDPKWYWRARLSGVYDGLYPLLHKRL